MVRVAGPEAAHLRRATRRRPPTGSPRRETLAAVSERVHELVEEQHRCFLEDIQPRLAAEGIRIVRPKEVTPEQARFLEDVLPPHAPPGGDAARRSTPAIPSRTSSTAPSAWWSSLRPTAAVASCPSAALAVVHIPRPGRPALRAAARAARRAHLHAARGRDPAAPAAALSTATRSSPAHAIRVTRDADVQPVAGRTAGGSAHGDRGRACASGGWATRSASSTIPTCRRRSSPRWWTSSSSSPTDLYAGEGFTAFSDLVPALRRGRPARGSRTGRSPPHPVPAFEGAADVWSAIRERRHPRPPPVPRRSTSSRASCRRRRPTRGCSPSR